MDTSITYIYTRSGKHEPLSFDKITKRLLDLINIEPKIQHVNAYELTKQVCGNIINDMHTYEIDEYIANRCASISISNYNYQILASRLAMDNHQRQNPLSFCEKMTIANSRTDYKYRPSPLVNDVAYNFILQHSDWIHQTINYSRDFLIDFFGLRTLQKIYSMRINDKPIETPQDMFMRTAIALHYTSDDVDEAKMLIASTYNALSLKLYTQASPAYFNALGLVPQYSSCFLLGTEDSLEGIQATETAMARISKTSGGIGVHVHCWRSNGMTIRGTNGLSNGIVPFLRKYDATMLAFNQGGKRAGSAAVYLSPHHPDIMAFLQLKLPNGIEEDRARNLFYAMWIPDLFMQRVESNGIWSLFDPDQTIDLSLFYDERTDATYTNKYLALEKAKLYTRQLPARDVWAAIFESNKQKGVPYLCFSDTANRTSMQKNIGTIRSSNLCSEIFLYSDEKEHAVCNLCSVSLPSFVTNGVFDFIKLIEIVKLCTINLNRIIDINYYPTAETELSNKRHRPIGIGVQGLADCYLKMNLAFESAEASALNKLIFETVYYAALSQSTRMCREQYIRAKKLEPDISPKAFAYSSAYAYTHATTKIVDDAPISKGIFHFELCGLTVEQLSGRYDWETLRQHILTYGVKNSVLIALMPTASTSQLLGNNECFEPYTSNLYKRKTLAGEFIVINRWLMEDLQKLNLYNENLKDYLLACEGSVQHIDGLPVELKAKYKTAFEIDQSVLIQQAIDRQPFIDQGQSLNWFLNNATLKQFTKLSFQAWRGGLPTGKYYLHTKEASPPQKFTIDHVLQREMLAKLTAVHTPKQVVIDELICDLCSG